MYSAKRRLLLAGAAPGRVVVLTVAVAVVFALRLPSLALSFARSSLAERAKKVVLVCTSASELKGHPTGLWIEECAAPYYLFKGAGYDVAIASPKGGPIPIDASSMADGFFTDEAKKFMHDAEAVGMLCHSLKVSDVDWSSADAVFACGGHGTCVDFHGDDGKALKQAIEAMHSSDEKVVAAVCHGPTALVDCVKPDGTTPLVQGRRVAAFTDAEEVAVKLEELVPFPLETKLRQLGAVVEKGSDWTSKVCVDGNLVTGQNPQSSVECAEAVIAILG